LIASGPSSLGDGGSPPTASGIGLPVGPLAVRERGVRGFDVLESMSEGVVVVDEDGLILFANSRLGEMFDHDPQALLGVPIELLVPEDLRGVHAEHRGKYATHPSTRTMGAGLRLFGRRRDGSELPIEVGLSSIETEAGVQVTAVVSDVSGRLQVEQELRESRALFRDLVEDLSVGVMIVGASTEVRTANRAAWTVLGIAKEHLIGRRIADVPITIVDEGGRPLPPHGWPVARALASREAVRGVILGITSRGRTEPIWVVASAEPRLNLDGSVRELIATYQDIGDLRAAERGLAAAELRFRSLVEHSPAVVYVRDLTSTPPRLTYVSPQVEEVLGYSQDRFTAEPELWLKAIHPEDRDRAGLHGPTEEEHPAGFEHRLLDSQGRVVWVRGRSSLMRDVTGRPLAEQGFFVDVTDEKSSTTALRESEAFGSAVFRSAREAILVLDADLRLRNVNPFAEEITGWQAGAATFPATAADVDFLTEGQVAEALRAAGDGVTSERLEVSYAAWDGGRGWLSLTVGPLQDADGTVTGAIVTGQEVTDRKGADAALRDQADRLAQQADELGRLADERRDLLAQIVTAQEDERTRVARELHDSLGGTLTSLTLFAAILEKELASPTERERVRGYRTRVEDAITEVRSLVSSLRPPELDEGLGSAIRRLVSDAEDGGPRIEFEDGAGEAQLAPAVVATLYRVVQEALANALHHAEAHVISITITEADDKVSVIVEDDGKGFDPEVLPNGHFGVIGMRERAALVGTLTVDSAPGHGTVVRIEVPA
jgi:PAS domain S-box-containing protein